jgi:tRNA G18 (ribose-2'-O)-methylase SpoU
LLTSRGVRKQRKALVSGSKQTKEILQYLPNLCEAWITKGDNQLPQSGAPDHLIWYQLAPALFHTLDVFGTDSPLLLIKTPEIPEWVPPDGFPPGCSLLVPFQDPENVGTVIRSGVAFGVAQIILLAESANPYHPKAIRASGGTTLRARLLQGPSLKDLPETLPIVALSPEGRSIYTFDFPQNFGLLPGMEGTGLPETWRKQAIAIPISPEVESLNAAAAAAIALFAWTGKRVAGGGS